MQVKIDTTIILNKQETELFELLQTFTSWLHSKKIIDKKNKIKYIVDMPFADDDWIMKVDGENVSFNTNLLKTCTFEYFKTIIVHEFFHLVVQRLPNKDDATKVKDDFGDQLLKLIDIQADFFTALFFKEVLNYNLVEYLKLYFEGRKVFSDKWIRPIKFERFIGTLLSIFKMFINGHNNNSDLYLPTITPIYTENRLHVLVIRKEHIYIDEINATYEDFVNLKSYYTDIDKYSVKGYVKGLVEFSCTAFGMPIPENIKNLIDQIVN